MSRLVRNCALALLVTVTAAAAPAVRLITLEQCLEQVLRQNRELQIERLNPAIARADLAGAFGYFDPLLVTDYRQENAADTGGFDPSDFSRDAVYAAESEVLRLGVTGYLPTGLSYAVTGAYANSHGERNLLNFDAHTVVAGITVRQPLLKNLLLDPGRFLIRANRQQVQLTEHGVNWLVLDLLNRTQWAYFEMLYAREFLAVQHELRAARARLLAGLERQAEQGMLAETAALPARTQLASLDAALLAGTNAVILAENSLKTLLGDDFRSHPETALSPVERLHVESRPVDLQASWQLGLADRPDLAQLRTALAQGELEVRFRRNQLLPAFDLVAGYGRRGASTDQLPPPLSAEASAADAFAQFGAGTAPNRMVGLVFTLPLSRTADRAAHRSSQHRRDQAELRVKQLEELVLRQIADAAQTVRLTQERTKATAQATDFARQALAAEERQLAGGRSSLFFVLQLQNELLAAQASELRAKADHLQAVSQLDFSEGSLSGRLGIRIESR